MCVLPGDDLLPDGGEAWQPGGEQVAVLEHDPVAGLAPLRDHLLRQGALALTQRQRL